MTKRSVIRRLLAACLVVAAVAVGSAQSIQVTPLAKDGRILVTLRMNDIFTDDVRAAMHSGLRITFVYDIELKHVVDLMLKVTAEAYSVEAANPQHEHEWKVWRETKLPDGKLLIPGVVSHATNVVEHPELVADRLARFARLVGPERVIAGTDCGLGGRIHPDIAWAKLETLAQGAGLASRQLYGGS